VTEEAGLEAGLVAWFADVSRADVGRVGGKGANLGELTRAFACRRGSW
jgi:phosphoenolpyruvate synthase/pyruvate phosphate dikinase